MKRAVRDREKRISRVSYSSAPGAEERTVASCSLVQRNENGRNPGPLQSVTRKRGSEKNKKRTKDAPFHIFVTISISQGWTTVANLTSTSLNSLNDFRMCLPTAPTVHSQWRMGLSNRNRKVLDLFLSLGKDSREASRSSAEHVGFPVRHLCSSSTRLHLHADRAIRWVLE